MNLLKSSYILRKLIFISTGLALFLALVAFAGCNRHKENSLETVLEMAGSNRQNLENVLRHFENDSAGLAAAEFLIRNMPMHVSYRDTVGLGCLNAVVDSCMEANKTAGCYDIREILLPLLTPVSNYSGKTIPDLQFIDDKSLIRHIETALRIWRESPWASHLDFDEFCEWLLPYKVQEIQPVDDWMNYLSPYFDTPLKTIGYCDIYKNSVSRACRMVNECIKDSLQPKLLITRFSPVVLSMKTRANISIGICAHYVALTTAVMRSKGLPVCIDFTPIWGYRNLGHEWIALLDRDGRTIPFDAVWSNPGDALKPDERLGKVFRHTFAPNRDIMDLLKSESFVPAPFNSPFIKDVTADYIPSTDVTVDLPRLNNNYVYLALSNRNGWTPVDVSKVKGGKVRFKNVGPGNVYAVLAYNPNGSQEVIGEPFLLDGDGSRHPFVADESDTSSVTLHRKYPVLPNVFDVTLRMLGGEFHVSDKPDFSTYSIVHTITEPSAIVHEFNVADTIKAGRYWRYCQNKPETFCNIAEIEFIDSTGNVMQGSVIGTDGYFGASINMTKEAVFDKDPLTMFDAPLGEGCWVGMDFGRPVHPAKITYLGRGDGNSIKKGDLYELSYFKDGGWHSLGRKIATEGHLNFNGVPKNALLYLRDLSKGQEDRIFTYENGQQVWR